MMGDETICHPLMSGKGFGGLVLSGEVKGGEVVGEEGLIDDFGGFLQHGGDVTEVFLGSAFTVEFEFADDEIFGGSEGDWEALDVDDPDILHRPAVERVSGDKIDIGFEKAVLADDIEVPPVAPDDFGGDDFGRGEIEIGFGKCGDEAGDIIGFDFEDEIDVVGEPGLTVSH
jgi:hypothetical protein